MAGTTSRADGNGVRMRAATVVAIVAIVIAIGSNAVTFLVAKAAAQERFEGRVSELETSRAAIEEKLCNIQRSVDRIERRLFEAP